MFLSCKAQSIPIEYETEKPSEAQINYTENKEDKTKQFTAYHF